MYVLADSIYASGEKTKDLGEKSGEKGVAQEWGPLQGNT